MCTERDKQVKTQLQVGMQLVRSHRTLRKHAGGRNGAEPSDAMPATPIFLNGLKEGPPPCLQSLKWQFKPPNLWT